MNKSTFQNVSIKQIAESKTNPRGASFQGPEFNDLVASIKEKGILVPLILRPVAKGYEVVAGSRRFRAAQTLKLTEVPATIQELTDAEAQEVQIIENLHRADVHPLEEAQAYRKLVEESHYEIPSIAAKVGKSESYVRQRIFLTRLEAPVAKAYRAGRITDGHAVLIAKLSANDQLTALERADNYGYSINDLKDYIDRDFYKPLERQPWLKEKDAMAAVGPCKECPPNVPGLFGAVKEGACTDTKCWNRKMGKYIDFRRDKYPGVPLISTEYSISATDRKGVISASNYHEIEGPKDKCEFSTTALITQGRKIGTQIRICHASQCKKHGKHRTSSSLTPAEKAKQDKERAAAKVREDNKKKAEEKIMAEALKKVTWPMTRKTLSVLLDRAIDNATDVDASCVRRGLEVKADRHSDAEKVLRLAIIKMTDIQQLQLLVEIVLDDMWNDDEKNKLIKSL